MSGDVGKKTCSWDQRHCGVAFWRRMRVWFPSWSSSVSFLSLLYSPSLNFNVNLNLIHIQQIRNDRICPKAPLEMTSLQFFLTRKEATEVLPLWEPGTGIIVTRQSWSQYTFLLTLSVREVISAWWRQQKLDQAEEPPVYKVPEQFLDPQAPHRRTHVRTWWFSLRTALTICSRPRRVPQKLSGTLWWLLSPLFNFKQTYVLTTCQTLCWMLQSQNWKCKYLPDKSWLTHCRDSQSSNKNKTYAVITVMGTPCYKIT